MDLMDMYENELSREKEKSNNMKVEIAGMELEIPKKLIQERMDRMYINTMEENLEEIRQTGEAFFKCFKSNGSNTKEDFHQQFLDYLDESIEVLRP